MSLVLRKLLVLFFAVWLPVSSVAAATMVQCAHDQAKQTQAAHAAGHEGGQHHASADPANASEQSATGECAKCGLCLFASIPWLPGTATSLDPGGAAAIIRGQFPSLHSLSIPPADRPPLAVA